MQARALALQSDERLHELREAPVGLEPARRIGNQLRFASYARDHCRPMLAQPARRQELGVDAVVERLELTLMRLGKLRFLEPGRADPDLACIELEQQPGVQRADPQPVVRAERRPQKVGIAVAGSVVPFEQAKRRRRGEGVLEIEPHPETGMEIDQIRVEAPLRQACGRPIHRLAQQHRPFERLEVVVGCGRAFPGGADLQPTHTGDLAPPGGMDEDDLIARIARQSSGEMSEMPRKIAMRKDDFAWLGLVKVQFEGSAIPPRLRF